MRAGNTDHCTAAGLLQQQVPVLLGFKTNGRAEHGNLKLTWRLGLPFKLPQETGVRRKQQGNRRGKKISGVKSAREKKEGAKTEGKVRGESMDLAAFEYVRAAGSWQEDFETRCLTNPLL